MSRALRVVWEGDFSGTGSLAQVNVELAIRLADVLDLHVVSSSAGEVDARVKALARAAPASVDVTIRHGSPPRLDPPPSGKWVWMQPWEYGACLPLPWLALMRRRVDAVWVYSSWVRRQLVDNGLAAQRVAVVPLGVDVTRFRPDAPPRPLPTDKRCRLLYLGGLTHRKGIDIVLKAYREAFDARDDVVLVIKEFNPEGSYGPVAFRAFDEILSGPDAPSTLRLPVDLAADELPGVYTACHALVHPYRAEGFCLPMAEAMASGLPVIATDRGGASEFAHDSTARLLPSRLLHLPSLELGRHRLSNFPGWREASRPHLVEAMRAVYEDRSSFRPLVERARGLIAERFTWDRAAEGAMRALEAVVAAPERLAPDEEPPSVAALLDEGDACLARGDGDGAAAAFHRALGALHEAPNAPFAARALRGLGEVAACHGLDENAYLFLCHALERTPGEPRLRLALAEAALRADRHDEGVRELQALLEDSDGEVRELAAARLFESILACDLG